MLTTQARARTVRISLNCHWAGLQATESGHFPDTQDSREYRGWVDTNGRKTAGICSYVRLVEKGGEHSSKAAKKADRIHEGLSPAWIYARFGGPSIPCVGPFCLSLKSAFSNAYRQSQVT